MMTVRLLPYASADGPANMADDEVMLEAAVAGAASLRFYIWSEATLSLGYFQPESARLADPRFECLPFVRRASGGAVLVHQHELTYALALPAGSAWQPRGESWICRMHGIVAGALLAIGVGTRDCRGEEEIKSDDVLCFAQHMAGDLILHGHKIVGSAQRKQRGALLQHGAILLAQSPSTPALPGLRELTGIAVSPEAVQAVVQSAFLAETGWDLVESDWSAGERERTQELIREKYATEAWNCKR